MILSHCDYMIGSPTALADASLEQELRKAAIHHGLYVPAGAFWGGEDIAKMAARNTLTVSNIYKIIYHHQENENIS